MYGENFLRFSEWFLISMIPAFFSGFEKFVITPFGRII